MKISRTLFSTFILISIIFLSVLQAQSQKANSGSTLPGKAYSTSDASEWVNLMLDPTSNFYETQQAFEVYWQGKTPDKGKGYKVYKRWENFMKPRVYPGGNIPKRDQALEEFEAFKAQYPQQFPTNKSVSGNWTSMGPNTTPVGTWNGNQPGGNGRVNFLEFNPKNSNIMWVGAPSGGLWVSRNGGTSWATTTDKLSVIGCSDLIINYIDTTIMYLATGDGDAGDTYSAGILKSTDAGVTWHTTSLNLAVSGGIVIRKLLVHPTNPDIMMAATNAGVIRTTDGWATYSVSTGAGSCADIEFKPNDPTVVYAAGALFYKSTDGGVTFSTITVTGAPTQQRYAIGVSPANANYVYLLGGRSSDQGFGGFFTSTNSGNTFTKTYSETVANHNLLGWQPNFSDAGGQAFYDMCIAVSPTTITEVYVGGVNLQKSTNGGTSWTCNAYWQTGYAYQYAHADHHALEWFPGSNAILFDGNDGGIFKTTNNGTAWTDISNNLGIAQIARMGISTTNSTQIMTGWQDNGVNRVRTGSWTHERGGDGCEAMCTPSNDNRVFGSYPNGAIYYSTVGGTTWSTITPTGSGTGDWNTPMIMDPTSSSIIYAGYTNVYRNANATPTSANWTSKGAPSGGTGYIINMALAPSAPSTTMYVAKTDRIWKTTNLNNATPTWTNITGTLPVGGAAITYIAVSNTDANKVWVTFSSYSSGNKVFYSSNGGTSWTNISGNLPNLPFNCVVYDKNSGQDGVYVGGDVGVYYKDNLMPSWALYSSNLPNVVINELEIYYDAVPANSRLRACTYGRGIWETDLYTRPLIAPVADFTSNKQVICQGNTVQFTDMSTNVPTGWSWAFSGGTPATSPAQNPSVTYTVTGTFPVTLTATNAYGSDVETKTAYITVGNTSLPFLEEFSTTLFPPTNWSLYSGNGADWKRGTASGNGSSTSAALFECYNFASGAKGEMITPNIQLGTGPSMTFNVSYRQYTTENDSLKVYISTDCGSTWVATPLYNKAGATLSTGAATTAYWRPTTAAGWRLETVSLATYANQAVRFKFVGTSNYGNNIWIDDINIQNTCSPAPSAAGAVTGTATVCQGQTGVAYSVAAITNATGYVWTLPYGASIATGANTNSITVDYTTYAASGNVTVKGVNTCAYGTVSAGFAVTVNKMPSTPDPIIGPLTVCQGQSNVLYYVPSLINYLTNQNGYVWTLPAGATIFSGNNNDSIYVNFSGAAVSGNISVHGDNGCVGAESPLLAITVNALPATPGAITGNINVCQGQNGVAYSITAIPGATGYTWTLPSGATIASGNNTNSITVNYSAGAVSGNITVYAINSCGNGSPQTLAVTVNSLPSQPSTITGSTTPCIGSSQTYSVTNVAGMIYTWTFPAGWTQTGGGTSNSVTVTVGATAGNIQVVPSNSCGTGTPRTLAVTPAANAPVSIAITASANPICAGTSVTFTATPTNGGTTPSYQWKLNGSNVGTNSTTYTNAALVNGDIITCVLTSNVACPTGNPATSNAITMTVNPSLPVSISISASATTICSGTSVTFTATPTNGGTTPAYQWKLNGGNVGTNSTTYTNATLANGDIITCVLTSNASCPTGNPATSNAITITVTGTVAPSITVSASANPICTGTSVTFTAIPVNGGTTPSYQWYLNGSAVGTNSPTYTNASLSNGNTVYCVLTSSLACASPTTATSNTVTMTVNGVVTPSVSITASSNPICSGTNVTFTAVPTNGGTTPSYQWYLNGNPVGTNSTTYSNAALSNGNTVYCIMTSSLACASPTTGTSNTITMTVNPSLPVSISVSASATTICTGTSVTFTATPTNGGTTPAYQWKLNGGNVGTNSTTYTNAALANGNIITCVLTSNVSCPTGNPATSNAITMTVTGVVAPIVSVSASSNPICTGTSVTFTAVPVNGGTTPSYQWYLNGSAVGTNSPTYTNASLSNGNTVYCVLTSSLSCASPTTATSNTITMTVTGTVVPGVSILASDNPICTGTSVTFTATPINGGITPSYQWYLNGGPVGANSNTYTNASLADGNTIYCVMTSSLACASPTTATSSTITMTVTGTLTPSVVIVASNNPICTGMSVTFTATPTNGGTTPAYQWYLNGNPVGSNSDVYTNASLANNDQVCCVLTSSSPCASPVSILSNIIIISVTGTVTPAVSITESDNPICTGTNVTFTATPVNGGSVPVYQWFLNGSPVGTSSDTYSNSTLANGDQVYCTMTSGLSCANPTSANSNSVTMTVGIPVTPEVSIVASSNPACLGSSVTFTATPVNGGPTPSYQWYLNGAPVGTNSNQYSSATLADGDIISCSMISNDACITVNPAVSNDITMIISTSLPVSVNISASENPVCEGDVVLFTATSVNGGSSPVYQWTVNGLNVGTNSDTYSYMLLTSGDIISCILNSSESCASGSPAASNDINMIVYPAPSTPSIYQSGDTLFSTEPNGNQWYFLTLNVLIPGATNQYYIPPASGSYYVIVTDINGCSSDTSNILNYIYIGLEDENTAMNYYIYPNPGSGLFTIQTNSVIENTTLKIVNVLGETLIQQGIFESKTEIDIHDLSDGIYFAEIVNKSGSIIMKILIHK